MRSLARRKPKRSCPFLAHDHLSRLSLRRFIIWCRLSRARIGPYAIAAVFHHFLGLKLGNVRAPFSHNLSGIIGQARVGVIRRNSSTMDTFYTLDCYTLDCSLVNFDQSPSPNRTILTLGERRSRQQFRT